MKKLALLFALFFLAGCTSLQQERSFDLISGMAAAKLGNIEYCSFIINNLQQKEKELQSKLLTVDEKLKEYTSLQLQTTTQIKQETTEKCEKLKAKSNKEICQEFKKALNERIEQTKVQLQGHLEELTMLKQKDATFQAKVLESKQKIMQDQSNIDAFQEYRTNLQFFC